MAPSISLGFHIGHDRGAAIVKDGELIGAISQERLDRRKHSISDEIPFEAIDCICEYLGIHINDISGVVFSGDELFGNQTERFIRKCFIEHYGLSRVEVRQIDHHLAHAWSAYVSSGFEDSFILVADGGGDYVGNMIQSESLYYAEGDSMELIESRLQHPLVGRFSRKTNYCVPFMPDFVKHNQISIGRKYEQITYLLGFGWGQAGKTMGLASYGSDHFEAPDFKNHDLNFSLTYADFLDSVYKEMERKGQSASSFLRENEADIAYAMQQFTEEAITSLVSYVTSKHKAASICFAGGLFLNCVANQRILDMCSGLGKAFFMPAAGDDGQAIGCALYAASQLRSPKLTVSSDFPYLGISYKSDDISEALKDFSSRLTYACLADEDLIEEIAKELYKDKIVGLVRGRTEIGPRALCHRSILASPLNIEMKEILNSKVKHREYFRPFAPVVTAERANEFFALKDSSPYMLLAPLVREEYREILPAITHVDNTARVQTIEESSEYFVHGLLKRFEDITSYPVLLNTSFNVAGDPIVESPRDAIITFLKTKIDILVLENYLVRKVN